MLAGVVTRSRVQELRIWHGSIDEGSTLMAAIEHNCTCDSLAHNAPRCGACALVTDQRILDRLLFARRIAQRLLAEEFESQTHSE